MSDTVTEEKETALDVVNDVVDQLEESSEKQEETVSQDETPEEVQQQEEKVPLSALKKVRQEAKEAKIKADLLDQQLQKFQMAQQQQIPQVDNSNDLLTVGEQQQTLQEWKRSILEEAYMEQNPQIVDRIKDELPDILSRHQWLADSLKQAPNRLHRAKEILSMFKPEKTVIPPPNRTNTPKSPQSVSKTNKLSTTDRLMEMSDQELEDWRLSQKRKIR